MSDRRPRVLFLCTGNSCRSQMAEAFARARWPEAVDACSAGTAPQARVDPRAVQVMAEIGLDLSSGHPKPVAAVDPGTVDLVVTVCDGAHESCPVFPGGARVVHHGFEDPPRLAQGAADEDEALAHYRRVRDEIRAFVEGLPGLLDLPPR